MDIFELLDNKFNICKQVDGLNTMIFREEPLYCYSSYSFANVFEKNLLRSWKYSKGRLSFAELFSDLNLFDYNNRRSVVKQIENEQQAYLCLQLDINIILYAKKNLQAFADYHWNRDKFFQEAIEKYSYIVDKSGLCIIEHPKEQYFIVAPRDEKVQKIAENTDKDTVFLLYEYTSPLLKGNFKKKREILKLISNKIEPMVKTYNSKYTSGLGHDIFKNLGMLLNNFDIRHPNTDSTILTYYKEPLTKYTPKEWEEIYDTTYQLILDAFLVDNYNNIYSSIIQKHKNNLGIN